MTMKKYLTLLLAKPSILVGGQAVIEGVMMRVPGAYATAVRDPGGDIVIDRHEFRSKTESSSVWKLPVLRGMMALYESLRMGMGTLQWSADVAATADKEAKAPSRTATAFSTLFAIVLAIVLFMAGPYWLTTHVFGIGKNALAFNAVAGLLRITFFIGYLLAISLLKDVRRLFQYHGAEHRVVYNFESGMNVSIKNAQSFPTQHPRCGTSFMFIVLISAILFFSVIDAVLITLFGPLTVSLRIFVHLLFVPLVAGASYEVIKITARRGSQPFFRMLKAPGLWLQRITTKIPGDDMVEVSITALKSAFGEKFEEMSGKKYIAEAMG
ncbi:MAG: DUF1385 domain-containing protein [Candidatus Neomarinimicrobiota bacterium]